MEEDVVLKQQYCAAVRKQVQLIETRVYPESDFLSMDEYRADGTVWMTSAQDVSMHVVDRLPGLRAGVENHPVAGVGDAFRDRYLPRVGH